ncbi:MAG: hypothetical protein ACFNVR_03975 [Selenomonas noxia]|uniref:hypothetical protein n=1 Tax=Selenomonas noxia TaxID=135083 RepID=UPI0032C05998
MAKAVTRAEKEKEAKELAMNIDTAVEIGMLEISNTQAMRVSIIRSRRRRYAAVPPVLPQVEQWAVETQGIGLDPRRACRKNCRTSRGCR